MRSVAHGDAPSVTLDHAAGMHFFHERRRTFARWMPSPLPKDEDAALMLDARVNVGSEDAGFAEQQLVHARNRRRTVDLEVGYAIGTLIPALEHQTRIVHAMVVVQVAYERM